MPVYLLFLLPMAFLLQPGTWAGEIIKGKEVKAHSRPYMAYLRIQRGTKMGRCGGFLVAENFVLTAAHCQAGKITVVLGAHNISRQEKSQQVIQVKKAYPHEEYDDVYSDNDIMLLELSTPAKLSKRVKPIALATAGKIVKPGKKCRVAGWGLTIAHNNSSSANTLREVQVKVLKDAECRDLRYNNWTMLCAGKAGKGDGATQGDSGGPLVCRGKAQGIVSWGPIDLPGVYTRLSTFIGWIQETMEGTPFCGPPGLTA
ncbi:mast cell protease 1A-like [Pelodiscus sinensis]|uniref:mast cell protease 1A-like n=1 Tax=Pelodiscus sinensis TaxID=13735 RepID=UPI003F6AC0D3